MRGLFGAFSLWCAASAVLFAQTSTSGTVVGVVTDPSHAVVANAEVQLLNVETNAVTTQATNAAGAYTFPNVTPGNYKLTVKMMGFRTATVGDLVVEVNKSLQQPIQLELGRDTEVVEVSASAAAQLQTTDAQIGNALATDSLLRLPTLQRNITELMALQPGVVPNTGSTSNLGMRVTGAIDDQNTVTVDGIDITANIVASNTIVPAPADSVEEFRVTTANPKANFDRASGGQIALIGRHGTNTLHGAGYWYHQTSDWNSNTWDNNYNKIAKPNILDNRYGGRLGGPIVKDKTFIFGNYEGRRFDSALQLTRIVPSDTLKQGILQFKDAAGNTQRFDLATASVCGPAGNQPCDPRGLGISPSVKALWALMPAGNPSLGGDGLNTLGFLANVPAPIQTDYGVVRLDHKFTDVLQFNGSYTYFRSITTAGGNQPQIEILNGAPQAESTVPQRGAVIAGGLTWNIKPALLNVFRFGYARDTNAGQVVTPTVAAGTLNIPGTTTAAGPVAILPGSGVSTFLDAPIDMDTQRARIQQHWDGDFQYIDDLTWIKGRHTAQFGVQINKLPYTHLRADKVVGSIASLVAQVDGQQGNLNIPAINTPPTCGASATANCLKTTDIQNWQRFYASTLGLVDNVGILALRDANLNPLPFGTPIVNVTNQWASYFYAQDTWRVTNSLTLTLGLSYGWQTAPTEAQNRQTVMVTAADGKLITAENFLQQRAQAALSGQIYNPTVGFNPVSIAKVPVYNVDYGNVAPRASFAWNPSASSGLLGKLLGDRKSVVRGGFGIIYDRSNTVQSVEIPMLGVGFDQTVSVRAPLCNATGSGGGGCNAALGAAANPGASVFRVGVDGTLPLPTVPAISAPVVPSLYGETLSFQVDPNTQIGRSYNVDLSVQREFGGGIIFEAAYVGRFARHLPQAVNLEQSPYFMVDSASGQTFAQAYDAVAAALRNKQAPSSLAPQPFFENQLPGIAAKNGATGSSTAYVASQLSSNFINGNLTSIFMQNGPSLDAYRRQLGLTPYTNDQAQMEFMRTYIGQSNYNGLLLTLTKRLSRGLQVSGNYTFARTLDDGLSNQNNAGFYANSFHPGTEYGPSTFDRTHVVNGYFIYEIPMGTGHLIGNNRIADRILGGWSTSGIFTAWSGLPVTVTESGQVWGDGLQITTNSAMIPVGPLPSVGTSSGVAGSNGVGTNGDPARRGTGLNLFSDPAAAYNDFRYVSISQDQRTGRANPMRGLPFWNLDANLSKRTAITERVAMRVAFDFFNIFNHHNLATPLLNYTNPQAFGVISSTIIPPNRTNSARWIQLGLRLEF